MEELLKKYLELKEQEDKVKAEKEEVAKQIKDLLTNEPNGKYEANGYKAALISKTTFKYTDETAIMNYLTQKGLGEVYIAKAIDNKKLNEELKSEGTMFEALKSFVTKNVSDSLTVKKD